MYLELKYPSLHLEADTQKCTKCKKCSRSCEMGLGVNSLVQSGTYMMQTVSYVEDVFLSANKM